MFQDPLPDYSAAVVLMFVETVIAHLNLIIFYNKSRHFADFIAPTLTTPADCKMRLQYRPRLQANIR